MFAERIQVDTADGADCVAFAAADALVVIDPGAEVFDRDSADLACLYALHAADAARRAVLARLCALIVVPAQHRRLGGVKREQVDKISRTGLDAQLAGAALVRVDACNAVAEEDCLIGTDRRAVAEAEAAVGAGFRSAEQLRRHFAGLHALIVELGADIFAVAAAHDGGDLRLDLARFPAEHTGNGSGDIVAAGNTEVTFDLIIGGKRGGVAVAAAVAAGAAVCTGQAVAHLFLGLIDRDGEDRRGDRQSETGDKPDGGDDEYGNENS